MIEEQGIQRISLVVSSSLSLPLPLSLSLSLSLHQIPMRAGCASSIFGNPTKKTKHSKAARTVNGANQKNRKKREEEETDLEVEKKNKPRRTTVKEDHESRAAKLRPVSGGRAGGCGRCPRHSRAHSPSLCPRRCTHIAILPAIQPLFILSQAADWHTCQQEEEAEQGKWLYSEARCWRRLWRWPPHRYDRAPTVLIMRFTFIRGVGPRTWEAAAAMARRVNSMSSLVMLLFAVDQCKSLHVGAAVCLVAFESGSEWGATSSH